MTEMPLPLKILADDRNKIMYRPSFAKITGSVLGAILLQQVLFRFDSSGGVKFYKFMQPCKHARYRAGDSWTEELGFSRYELAAALKMIGTKSTAGANKNELMSVNKPDFNSSGTMTNAFNLVIYWTDSSRVTWFWLNAILLGNAVMQHYLGNSEIQHYLVNLQSSITYEKLDSNITFNTENTSNTTIDKKADERPANPLLEKWNKYSILGNALLKAFQNDFVPIENQPIAAIEPYLVVAEDLTRIGVPVEHIPLLHKHVTAKAERENWKGFSVKALPKYYPELLKEISKSAQSRKPAVILDSAEPTAAERAALDEARKAIRPEWEKEAANE